MKLYHFAVLFLFVLHSNAATNNRCILIGAFNDLVNYDQKYVWVCRAIVIEL